MLTLDMGHAIETIGLGKDFGAIRAVDSLDLSVDTGEVFGFLGPNGAGKSTTIRLLLDHIRPSRGAASILGLDSHRDAIAVHARTGYLPGELTLPRDITANRYFDFLSGLRRLDDRRLRDELVERLDLDPQRRLGTLSTGNKRKVGLVQAFMHQPEVILLDEPTTGLDPLVQHEVHELLREVASSGATIFLSSHTLSEVDRVADRVGIIRHGRLVTIDSVARLRHRALHRIEFEFAEVPDLDVFGPAHGVRDLVVKGRTVTVTIEGPVDRLLRRALAAGEVLSLHTPEADLEEIFLDFYRDLPDDPSEGTT